MTYLFARIGAARAISRGRRSVMDPEPISHPESFPELEPADSLIREAIAERIPLAGRYHGHDRWFCPHALGSKDGTSHLLVYQFSGGSERGLPAGGDWRCLRLSDLESLRPAPGPWRTGANLFGMQSCLDEIEALVQPLPPRLKEATAGE
jgi:hypothetical protein